MSFSVSKSDGKTIVVQDYQKTIAGGLQLLGFGYANYSDEMAQNFVKDLENNAGTAEPTNPLVGQFWFQLPSDVLTGNRLVRICVSNISPTLDGRWKTLFAIDPQGNVLLDAWTLRGAAPVIGGGSPVNAGQVVVRDGNGKIDPSNIYSTAAQTEVDAANRLKNPRTFGSRAGGIAFNGTQDVPLTSSHIAEGDQLYFSTTRARQSISGAGAIQYDPNSGVISYNPPANAAALRSFQGRTTEAAVLTQQDVVNVGGALVSQLAAKLDTSAYTATDVFSKVLSLDGEASFLDADLLDGHHASDFLTKTSFASSLDVSGWQKIPGGMTIQWGSFAWFDNMHNATYSYPIAFDNFAFQVYLSIKGNPNGSGDRNEEDDEQIWANTATNTYFTVADTGDDHTTYQVAWLAIGY